MTLEPQNSLNFANSGQKDNLRSKKSASSWGGVIDRIFKHAGEIRKYNISKKEWVLNGDSVMYGASFELRKALDYDFECEREFKYSNLSMDEIVRHLSSPAGAGISRKVLPEPVNGRA